MVVVAYANQIQCTRAVKGPDYIRLYDAADNMIASFKGISDFTGYSITDGNWSAPEPTPEERLAAIETLLCQYPEMRQALEELGVVFGG